MSTAVSQASFQQYLQRGAARIEAALETVLPQPGGAAFGEDALLDAMRYAVLGGGKRLRGFLVLESAALFDVAPAHADRVAAAIECLHAYSLVHDDLPCMDDDDLRRGKPTVHLAYSEATAVLTGDALLTLAFEILAEPETHPAAAVRADLTLGLARHAGPRGMVAGQAIDLGAESAGRTLSAAETARLQALKTGALIEFSAEAGAILGQAAEADRTRLRAYARDLGIAFQIADDLLDATGSEAETGKRVGKDAEAGKATFIDLYGLEGARAEAARLVESAGAHLAPYGERADTLKAAAAFIVERSS
ncbi:MAG: polyprenyl synthetase family protein [Pseudomonadota bacterium]